MRVGVDLGGTTIKIGFFDDKKIIEKFEIKTVKDTLFDDIFKAIKNKEKEKNYSIEGIGFGLPGHVLNTYIDNLPNIGISNYDFKEIADKYYKNIIIKTTNDANAAALGEAIYNNVSDILFITLGTGVGGGIINNYKVYEGFHNNAGEIGHIFIDYKHNFKCACGLSGCLETCASATGIVRVAKTHFNEFKTKLDINNLSSKIIFDYAKNGDELAVFAVDYMSDALARAIANILLVSDSKEVLIGGGVSKAGKYLEDRINFYFKKYAFYAIKDVKIRISDLGNDAGIIGASHLW